MAGGVTLDVVAVGRRVTIVAVEGDDPLSARLVSLGMLPGVEVQVLRRAPFGDPTEYKLHGYRLGLRRAEARRVTVDDG